MSLINRAAIENLKDLEEKTGQNLIANLSKLYIDTTPDILKKMELSFNNKMFETLSNEAHSLKSSSANIGAHDIANICQSIESMITTQTSFSEDKIKSLLIEINDIYPKILAELKAYT
ncbi:MAG: Hpt domain-containing protein [Bdellovibrionales bacterium]|nr:Hpt domain-containing protein [Bdellovibrionales bacterium]